MAVALIGAAPGVAGAETTIPLDTLPGTGAAANYVVTLAADPIATYAGDVKGLKSTRPANGRKVEAETDDAQRYREYLIDQQDEVAAQAKAKIKQRYAVSLNGFSATLTPQQARTLERTEGVVSVTKDTLHKPTDDKNSTDYLNLSGETGVWSSLGGIDEAGKGVVVGVIDSGIWPESASFAGSKLKSAKPTADDPYRPYKSGNKITMNKSDGSTFTGSCQPGQQWSAKLCTTKLVGAKYFGDAWMANVPQQDRRDFISTRDGGGHGSHTASTAAGNNGVAASIDDIDFGEISGVAPAAKVAAYKVLWEGRTEQQSGGWTSDIVAAIDAAVSDGVDVINYSIGGGSESPHDDPIGLAFLSAASAGIFVSASAGNSGPGAATMDNTTPWLTTVAASTIAPYEGTVVLGNGEQYAGSSTTVTTDVGPASLVNAIAVKAAAATETDAALCVPDSLDPAATAGKIVVCDRGVVDRVAKSAEVERAGGLAMVMVNLTENSLNGDIHSVPTVHVNPPASAPIKAYAENADATATLSPGNLTSDQTPYPQIAGFSSRGPSNSSGGDLLKPDIAAPGVDILAAVAPPSNGDRDFDFYSGTSMAAPHIAGLAALYLGKHPRWSASKIKSAMMTTSGDLVGPDGAASQDPFAQGAGEVTPAKMFNPGLVFTARDRDWLAYLEGIGVDTGTGVKAKDPSDYNAPSIAVGQLLDHQTVTRKVTAVKPGIYKAKISVPGLKATVTPSILSFDKAGQTKTFKVTFKKDTAAYDEAATGFLTWSGAGTTARMPIAVTPKVVTAPAAISGSGADGTIDFEVTPGVNGPFPIKAYGLAEGEAVTGELTPGAQQQIPTEVPAGAKVAQFSLRTSEPAADLDLYLYQVVEGVGVLIAQSATAAADETITVPAPEAGLYIALAVGYSNAPGTSSTPFTYRGASVTTEPGVGNFAVAPANPTATIQEPIPLQASWSGLGANTPAIGYIEYPGGSGTVVTIN